MKLFRKATATVVVAFVTMLCAPSLTVRAQVLDQVPADALVVVKFNNLKATSDKLAKYSQDLGVAAMSPEMADPLGALQAKTNMKAGIDTAGELAFVFVDPATVGGNPQDAIFFLMPVTDYKAFLGNWSDAKTEGEISEIKFPEDPKPAFVTNWGKYAAISPSKLAITTKPTAGLKAPSIAGKELASKDAVVYANFASIRAKVLPEIQSHRATILEQVENGMKNEPKAAKFVPVVKAVVNQVLNGAEEFLNDAQAATLGVSIVPDAGLNVTILSEFTPDTYIGKMMTSFKNTDAPLLGGLPTGKYLVYGGGIADPAVGTKIVEDLLGPIVKEVVAIGPEMKPAQDYFDAIKAYVGAMKSQSYGVVAPEGAIGASPLLQFVSVQKGDPQTLAAAYTKMLESQGELMKSLNIPGAAAAVPTRTANAKTLDGVTFDTIVTKVDMNAQDPVAMQQAQMMNMMYGPNGMVMDVGTVGDSVISASGVSDQFLSSTIAAVKGNLSPLADADKTKSISAHLPKQRLAVAYVPLDDIVTTVLTYAKQFGFALNVQLPPDLPPIGAAASTEGSAMKIDVHIPTPLVQSLVAAGMQAAMQMQGGGGQQGGGL